jgi:hypothetical protein
MYHGMNSGGFLGDMGQNTIGNPNNSGLVGMGESNPNQNSSMLNMQQNPGTMGSLQTSQALGMNNMQTSNGNQNALGNTQSAMNSMQTSMEGNLMNKNQNSNGTQQNAVGTPQSPIGNQQNTAGQQQSSVCSQNPMGTQSSVGTQQSVVGNQQNTVGSAQNSIMNPHNPIAVQQNPMGNTHSSMGASQNPVGTSRQLIGVQQNSMGTSQNMLMNSQNTMGNGQSLMGTPNTLGAPQNSVGAPQNAMGMSQNLIGTTQNIMGTLQNPMVSPQISMGAPQNTMGTTPNLMAPPQNSIGTSQNPMEVSQSAMVNPQNPIGSSQSPMGTSQSTMGNAQNPMSSLQNPVPPPQNMMAVSQNPMAPPQNSMAISQNPVGATQNSSGTPQSTVGSQQNMLGTPKNPMAAPNAMGVTQNQIGTAQDSSGNAQNLMGNSQNPLSSFQSPVGNNSQNLNIMQNTHNHMHGHPELGGNTGNSMQDTYGRMSGMDPNNPRQNTAYNAGNSMGPYQHQQMYQNSNSRPCLQQGNGSCGGGADNMYGSMPGNVQYLGENMGNMPMCKTEPGGQNSLSNMMTVDGSSSSTPGTHGSGELSLYGPQSGGIPYANRWDDNSTNGRFSSASQRCEENKGKCEGNIKEESQNMSTDGSALMCNEDKRRFGEGDNCHEQNNGSNPQMKSVDSADQMISCEKQPLTRDPVKLLADMKPVDSGTNIEQDRKSSSIASCNVQQNVNINSTNPPPSSVKTEDKASLNCSNETQTDIPPIPANNYGNLNVKSDMSTQHNAFKVETGAIKSDGHKEGRDAKECELGNLSEDKKASDNAESVTVESKDASCGTQNFDCPKDLNQVVEVAPGAARNLGGREDPGIPYDWVSSSDYCI